MSYLIPDLTEEQERKLTEAGWTYLTNSWGRSIWRSEEEGQLWATEALELIEADDEG